MNNIISDCLRPKPTWKVNSTISIHGIYVVNCIQNWNLFQFQIVDDKSKLNLTFCHLLRNVKENMEELANVSTQIFQFEHILRIFEIFHEIISWFFWDPIYRKRTINNYFFYSHNHYMVYVESSKRYTLRSWSSSEVHISRLVHRKIRGWTD